MDKKTLTNLTPFERWQMERYNNILPPVNIPNEGKFENGIEEERRFSEWMQHEAEQQMLRDEEYYSSIKD